MNIGDRVKVHSKDLPAFIGKISAFNEIEKFVLIQDSKGEIHYLSTNEVTPIPSALRLKEVF